MVSGHELFIRALTVQFQDAPRASLEDLKAQSKVEKVAHLMLGFWHARPTYAVLLVRFQKTPCMLKCKSQVHMLLSFVLMYCQYTDVRKNTNSRQDLS